MEELIPKVYNHIGTASIGNVLSIRQKFSFKEGEEGFSPEEFCDKFIDYCITKINEGESAPNVSRLIMRTMDFKIDLFLNGRKDSMMDIYLLDIRRIRRSFEE